MWAFFEQPNLLTFLNLQSSPLIIFVALSWSHSSKSMCSLAMGRPTQHPESRIQNPESRCVSPGQNSREGFLAVRVHCWQLVHQNVQVLLCQSDFQIVSLQHGLVHALGLFLPMEKTLCFSFLGFMRLMFVHSPSLSWSLWMAAHPYDYQPLPPVLCHLQTCGRCMMCQHPGLWWRQ